MQVLKGEKTYLRALEPEDLDFLFEVENDSVFWEVSSTETPFSKFILEQYIANSHLDIYTAKQLRLVISDYKNNTVGMIDLFDYNPKHHRAGIGILIKNEYQNNGFASEALQLLINYCFNTLAVHQLYANITIDNTTSLKLFKNAGFEQVGIKKDWIHVGDAYKHEVLFQLLKK